MDSFFKKPTPREQARKQEKDLRRNQRDIERDRRDLEVQEKQVEADIRKLAKQGNKEGCVILAKQLINLRKQKTRSYGMSAKMSGINSQTKTMMSSMKMADAMKNTTKVVGQMNKNMDPMKVAQTMQEFEKANAKIDMSEEMINDALDNILSESGDEDEEDAVVNKILDELNIETSGKLANAPSAHHGALGAKQSSTASTSKKMTDDDIERMLQNLKS